MSKTLNMGIIGCGDFLRWQAGDIQRSSKVKVTALYDPDTSRAEKFAGLFGGKVAGSVEEILNDSTVDGVCLFVPPWIRKGILIQAAEAGKHILTTKPLGTTLSDCLDMVNAIDGNVQCGVIYRRTGNAMVETCKKIYESGEVGKLSLYKQDWLHHYPEWNQWAIDPEKNGGPFMDAMVHNMNIARYLMDRPVTTCTFFSDNHAHFLKCRDTEFMKLDFEGEGSAHLFITWAADLEVFSKEGNDREHIDLFYMITDQGWRLTEETVDGKAYIVATKEGKKKIWEICGLEQTHFDAFADTVENGQPLPSDIPSILHACEDIQIIKQAEKNIGQRFKVDFSL